MNGVRFYSAAVIHLLGESVEEDYGGRLEPSLEGVQHSGCEGRGA